MSRAAYSYRWCYICGTNQKASGASWVSHCRKHVREGKLIERKVDDGKGRSHYEFQIVKGVKIIVPPKVV